WAAHCTAARLPPQPCECTLLHRLGLSRFGVGLLGLLQANQAVAVRVEPGKGRVAAEELAAGNVAVAVAVHLAEPDGAGAALGRWAGGERLLHHAAAAEGVAGAGAERQRVVARDLVAREVAVAVAVERVQQLRGLPQLAEAEPAVVV